MEMHAVMGVTVDRLYNNIVEGWGPYHDLVALMRLVQKAAKAKLKQLNASSITATEVDSDPITNIRTTSLCKDMPIDYVRGETETGWFVARPSGAQRICIESMKAIKGIKA